jgi:hypothetical protein
MSKEEKRTDFGSFLNDLSKKINALNDEDDNFAIKELTNEAIFYCFEVLKGDTNTELYSYHFSAMESMTIPYLKWLQPQVTEKEYSEISKPFINFLGDDFNVEKVNYQNIISYENK